MILVLNMEFDLKEALLLASFSVKQRFQGFRNTEELKDTVKDVFSGVNEELTIIDVQGRLDNFEAKIGINVRTEDKIENLLEKFEENTKVTVKKSVIK